MYQEERLVEIVGYLKRHERISIEQICSLFNVSRDTARRDLVKLEEQRLIVRTRGGAILPAVNQEILNYTNRLKQVSEEKKAIGKKAASLIYPGDKVIFDATTTVQACAEQMDPIDCTVITNSINIANILSSKPKIDIQLLGGKLHKEHQFLYGIDVLDKLSNYYVNKAFIGITGISEQGITDGYEEEGIVKKKMIEQAKQVIVLADHTKLGKTGFYQFADLSNVDIFITDQIPPKSFRDILNSYHVELLTIEQDEEEDE
ncbi:DeoR/GlpR family DNA-binding transcription regulator [Neobacillus mesonae]|uniref:DeoR/GlpR family DNA-binding transcription regulator n=1 Tax=Neobacillus mesonae TaxID=1193713 RepID=UPI00203F658E|nr:DeoR/GlpR family DNA-binding transcription regulator [Neobacillus mesonae]MCM3570418.1 DeoR/GlpR family DNA-binding transcription regulator [Neobacillus mesonae]